jgi:glycosyltransferase involved in cell wall biosynthesis
MKYGAHVTIIGNEDQQGYKQELLDFVANHNLHDKVNFRDQLPRHALLQEFANFDLIVFPSRRLEAFSLTVVEAQAKGLAVVYSAVGGGITDTVGDGGIPVENNSPEGLAQVLDNIYEHPQLLAEARAKGLENAEQYRLSASRDRLFGLSKELIDARAANGTL